MGAEVGANDGVADGDDTHSRFLMAGCWDGDSGDCMNAAAAADELTAWVWDGGDMDGARTWVLWMPDSTRRCGDAGPVVARRVGITLG